MRGKRCACGMGGSSFRSTAECHPIPLWSPVYKCRYLPTFVRASEVHGASRRCVKLGAAVVPAENLHRAIQEDVDIDGLMRPRHEERALGKGKDGQWWSLKPRYFPRASSTIRWCVGRDSFRDSVRKALTGLTPPRHSGAGRAVSHDAGVFPATEGVGCVWVAFWQ